ncbi:TIGR02453 family protein [Clostridia bacterium]|nr:TIGR02453 family protein [Clostridia bacterium]
MPFEGFSQKTIDFMWDIRFNNNKPWFEAHKAAYQRDLLAPMKALGQEVFARVSETYGGRGFVHKVSRIYKDARRNHGDGPYRDHLWFSIEKPSEEWTRTPTFWFELSPDSWSYGLGYYQARAETMAKLRARIDHNSKAFEKFVAPLAAQDEFTLDGDAYKRKKQAPTPKTEAWYNKKTFSLIHQGQIEDALFSPELAVRITGGFAFLMPFYDYFSALDAD